MKALTLWRPWPWAIFHAPHNAKRLENRSWRPPRYIIGKPIALHAGKTFDREAVPDILELTLTKVLPASATDLGLIGVATVVGVVDDDDDAMLKGREEQGDWYSGPFGWVLDDVRAFKEPIRCDGRQGLWDVPRWAEPLIAEALR